MCVDVSVQDYMRDFDVGRLKRLCVDVILQEYLRDFDVGGMSFQPTGRLCEHQACRGVLIDQVCCDVHSSPSHRYTMSWCSTRAPGMQTS